MNNDYQAPHHSIKVVTLVLFFLYFLILVGSLNSMESGLSSAGFLALGLVLVFANVGNFSMLLSTRSLHKTQISIGILVILSLIHI